MAEDGGGLELNIFSAPVAPQPARKKKRGSGKAWDKKKKTRPLPLDSIHDDAAQLGKAAQPPAAGSDDSVGARHRKTHRPQQTESSGSTVVGAAKLHQQHEKDESGKDRQRLATTGRAADSHSTIAADPVGGAGKASGGRKSELSSTAMMKPSHSNGDNNGPHKGAARSIDKEPSHERRRVLEVAGRVAAATTLHGSPVDGATSPGPRNNKKMTAAASTNVEDKKKSAKKRKRSSEPVVANGVIDFTSDKADHDKSQSNKNVRRSASTAAAVAKATAKIEEAGVHKWWDDDDDDDVSTIAASQVAQAPPTAAGGWRGKSGATAGDAPKDEDGGLPSDVHPNSIPTKAVDMDAEASNAMGILAALLGSSGEGGGGGTEPRLKNGGKSKKRAREEGPTVIRDPDREPVASPTGRDEGNDVPVGGSVTPFPGAAEAGRDATAGGEAQTVEPAQKRGTSDARTASTGAVASNGDGNGQGTTAARKTASGLSGGGVSDEQITAGAGPITRKTRGKHEREGAATHGSDTVPLPEHHARPRELSRRAAAAPLASARSGHVMAAGPGATFAALGLPPKMVAHLVEPKGESGGGGLGLVGPTVCQLAAIPTLAAGHNTVVKSETGSGKTLTYLLPLLCDLAARDPKVERENGTLAIVLAPTRELCAQILEVVFTHVLMFCRSGAGDSRGLVSIVPT